MTPEMSPGQAARCLLRRHGARAIHHDAGGSLSVCDLAQQTQARHRLVLLGELTAHAQRAQGE